MWAVFVRRARGLLSVWIWLIGVSPLAAQSAIDDVNGRIVASVEVVVGGTPVQDPHVLALVEQPAGAPFDAVAVRESIFHFVNQGRYDDIRVDATTRGAQLLLRFTLVPRREVTAVRFHGNLGLSEGTLRDGIDPRLLGEPTPARVAAAERTLAQLLEGRGFLQATVDASVVDLPDSLERSEILFEIDAGPEARVSRVDLNVDDPAVFSGVATRLGLEVGRGYDRQSTDTRLQRELRALHDRGYLEATLSIEATPRDDGSLVVTVDGHAGPMVEVRFEGDALPREVRDTLVPVRQEAAIDEDLLEDAQRNLERYLRERGYSRAAVSYRREGGGARRYIVFSVDTGPVFRVTDVQLEGNSVVPTAELQPLLGLAAGDLFTEAKLDAAESAIRRAYLDRGFADVRVSSAIDDIGVPQGGGPELERAVEPRIVITEGTQLSVAAVRFVGGEALSDEVRRKAVGFTVGAPFVAARVVEAVGALDLLYQRAGYRDVRVDPHVSRREAGVDVEFHVVEGLQAITGQVIVSGNRRIGTSTILREVPIEPGDPLGAEQLLEIQRRVAALGLFRRVQVTEAVQPGSTSRDVVVVVEEAPPTTIGYGGGVEVGSRSVAEAGAEAASERVEFAWRTFFQVGRRNLFGKNRSVNLFTRASLRRKNASQIEDEPSGRSLGLNEYRVIGSFQEPRVFGTTANAQVSSFFEQTIRASFSFVRRGAQAEVTRSLRRGLTLVGRYTYDNTRLFDQQLRPEDRPLVDRLFPQVRLSTLSLGSLRDTRDDPLDATEGTLLGFDQTFALRALGSEVAFSKSFLQGAIYRRLPVVARAVWATRVQVGLARGFGQPSAVEGSAGDATIVRDLPASERFFAGGAITVRGFALDRLGDEATLRDDGFPTGGNGMVIVNTELRLPLWRSLGGAIFLDAGNVFQRVSDIRITSLRASPGFGLRYRSPLGPVRVDLGFKLDRRRFRNGERERPTAFHISIGQAF